MCAEVERGFTKGIVKYLKMVILTQALETQLFGYVDEVYQMKALEPALVSLQTKFFQLILDTAVRNKQSKGP